MNTIYTEHFNKLREAADLLGATSFGEYGNVCHFSKNREWHLFAYLDDDPLHYTIGIRVPNGRTYDTYTYPLSPQVYITQTYASKSCDAKFLVKIITQNLLPYAIIVAKAMRWAEEEARNYTKNIGWLKNKT